MISKNQAIFQTTHQKTPPTSIFEIFSKNVTEKRKFVIQFPFANSSSHNVTHEKNRQLPNFQATISPLIFGLTSANRKIVKGKSNDKLP